MFKYGSRGRIRTYDPLINSYRNNVAMNGDTWRFVPLFELKPVVVVSCRGSR
jgi:hypothetical protein